MSLKQRKVGKASSSKVMGPPLEDPQVFLGEETATHSSQSDTMGRAGREGLGFKTSPQAVLPKGDRTGNVTVQHKCQSRPCPSAMSCRENKLKKWFLKLPSSQGTVEASLPASEYPPATAVPTPHQSARLTAIHLQRQHVLKPSLAYLSQFTCDTQRHRMLFFTVRRAGTARLSWTSIFGASLSVLKAGAVQSPPGSGPDGRLLQLLPGVIYLHALNQVSRSEQKRFLLEPN